MKVDPEKLEKIVRSAKRLAIEYRALTGRPLGITGEIAECEAAQILGLEVGIKGARLW